MSHVGAVVIVGIIAPTIHTVDSTLHDNGAFQAPKSLSAGSIHTAAAIHATWNQLTTILSFDFSEASSVVARSPAHSISLWPILNLNKFMLFCVYLSLCLITIGGPPSRKAEAKNKTISSLLFVFSYFNSSNFFSRRLSHICLSLKTLSSVLFCCYTFRLQ